jgi:hypothetical protein
MTNFIPQNTRSIFPMSLIITKVSNNNEIEEIDLDELDFAIKKMKNDKATSVDLRSFRNKC